MLIKCIAQGAAHYCLSVFLLLGFLASIPRAAFNYPYLPRRTGPPPCYRCSATGRADRRGHGDSQAKPKYRKELHGENRLERDDEWEAPGDRSGDGIRSELCEAGATWKNKTWEAQWGLGVT